jgi:hypothetical protein
MRSRMRIFDFDPADHREEYAERGYLHIRGGITGEFLEHLRGFVAERFGEQEVEGKAIGGRKSQAIYEAGPEIDFPGELFDVVAATCGLERQTMTLSERHIKAYDDDAPEEVPAHKDRFASQVSMGLSIEVPAGSRLVLYPEVDVGVNPFNVSAALRESLEPGRLPENLLPGAPETELYDEPGDVMMFPGNALWHFRRRQANATLLYLKLNDFGSDPLGEDPSTPVRRSETLAALNGGGAGIEGLVPVLSRRLDTLTREYTREPRLEILRAHVWEEAPIPLEPDDFRLLEAVDGRTPLGRLAVSLAADGDIGARVRRLAEKGALDLLLPAA